jgi:diketogulonate reductase-like aldo/keto reductase
LAASRLGGKEKRTFDDPTLREIAGRHSKSPAQVMLRWHLQEGRSAIPKSTKPARIAENFDIFGRTPLMESWLQKTHAAFARSVVPR